MNMTFDASQSTNVVPLFPEAHGLAVETVICDANGAPAQRSLMPLVKLISALKTPFRAG